MCFFHEHFKIYHFDCSGTAFNQKIDHTFIKEQVCSIFLNEIFARILKLGQKSQVRPLQVGTDCNYGPKITAHSALGKNFIYKINVV